MTMSAAERQRRRRLRKRLDRITVPIEVGREQREAMIDAGQLAEWNEDDPEAIRQALQAYTDNLRTVTA